MFQKDVPQAIYIHCFNHRLNLVLVDCCHRIGKIAEFFVALEQLYVFFSGSIPHQKLLVKQKETRPQHQPIELKRISDTRWSSQEQACIAVKSTLPAIVLSLKELSQEGGGKRAVDSKSNLALIDFEFTVILVFMTSLLSITKTLSDQLQASTLDLASAVDLILTVINTLKCKRDDVEFSKIWKEANDLWESIENENVNRPVRKKQQSRTLDSYFVDSTLGSTDKLENEKDFCTQYYYPVIDNLLEELQKRFSDKACSVMRGIAALNPSGAQFLEFDEIIVMAEHYGITAKHLKTELDQVQRMLVIKKDKGISVKSTLEFAQILEPYRDAFFDLHKLVNISLTLPVTSASCERSFSALKLIKTPLRSTSGHERTSDIAVLSVNEARTKKLDIESVIDLFATNHQNRRIVLK